MQVLEHRFLFAATQPLPYDLALIDSSLPDAQVLIDAALGNTRVIAYDGATESAREVLGRVVASAAASGGWIASLSIFSHGLAGRFRLGNDWISAGDLAGTAGQWRDLRAAFAPGASVQIYGCDTADGVGGQQLLGELSRCTGTAVFGSTNITGHDGDWKLEAAARPGGATSPAPVDPRPPLDPAALAAYPDDLIWTGANTGSVNDGNVATSGVDLTVAALAFTVTNTDDAGAGSLRAAVASADAAAGPSAILFNLPTSDPNYDPSTGTWTIVPTTALPTITAAVTVDGTSQPGYAGSPLVVLRATSAHPSIDGLTLGAGSGGSTIEGLTLGGFVHAIVVDSPGNTIEGNWIGLAADGTAADYNTYGICVDDAGLNLIGGTAAGAGNVISGNDVGVYLDGAATTGTQLEGNDIGTDPTGSVAIGNSSYGVQVTAGSGGNSIGGTAAGAGNLISGNSEFGVVLGGPGNTVAGNTIGLNAAGNAAVPNEYGLYLSDAAGNTIGGTTAAARNVISGNSNDGVYLTGAATTGNLIEGNYIGTDATGTVALGNGQTGVDVEGGATGNTIGGPAAGAGNVLSGNQVDVELGADANVVAGNVIGLDATAAVSLGSVAGVLVEGAGNTIGGTAAADANVIAGSTYVGVYVVGATATGDAIEGNSIHDNGGLGIDLADAGDPPSGITPNTGALTPGQPNLLMNDPVFDWAYLTGTSLSVSGYVGSAPGQSAFAGSRVEVFASDDSAANGSGQTLLGVLTTDANGDFAGTLSGVTAVTVGTTLVTGTATDAAGDTSEFGPNYGVTSPTALATAASASPAAVVGTTTDLLSALGDNGGYGSSLTYTWATTGTPPAPVAFSDNGTDAAQATTATFAAAGTYDFQVTIADTDGLYVTSAVTVTVTQTLTTVAPIPGTASLNENATQPFAATGYDQFGMPMASQPTFTWTMTSGVGSISAAGLYTAPGSAGTATVTATAGSVSGSATVAVTNAAPTVATAAAASPALVTGTTTALSVLGADDNGEPNLTYTWATTTAPAGSNPTFSADGTNAARASTVTFDRAGTYTFTVKIDDGQGGTVTSAVSVTVAQTLTTVVVTPGTASLNENGTQPFAATGYDQFGVAMASQPPFAWARGSGTGSVSGTGLYTAPAAAGSATVTATSGAVTGSATVTVTNAAPTIATAAAATPSPVTGTTTVLSVLGTDDNGEPNLTYTWAATTAPAGASPAFSANGTNGAKASTVTFDRAGSYTFTVTIDDGQGGTVTSAVSVTVDQALTSITVAPATTTVHENQMQQLVATGDDQFGQPMAVQPAITWAVAAGAGSVDASGLYTAPPVTGAATVTATSGSVAGSAAITVSNTAPTVATAAAASPSAVTGTTTVLSVLGASDNGEPSLTYTWAATTAPAGASPAFSANGTNGAKSSTVTFDHAGLYRFTVTISDGQGGSATSGVNVTVDQSLATVAVTPAAAALNEDQTRQFTATGYDQFGAAMASQPPFAWAVATGAGAVDGSGLYTAPAVAGTATVTATSGPATGSAAVTVTNAPPTVATPAAATPSPVTGTAASLSVLGADDNGEANLTYTWAATTKPIGSGPTFSANGTNGAKNSTVTFDAAGSYTFTVTISDGQGGTVTSAVGVVVGQTLASIAVTPATVPLNENGTRQLAATGYDQFGAAMASQPAVAWSVSGGIGAVDGAGLFTAPAISGTATVAATSGGVTGQATVTVTNAVPTVAVAAAASPAAVTGTSTALSVLGADDGGEPNLTYTWTVTAAPAGASPAFSANGTNGAKATTVAFDRAGTYTFAVTIADAGGNTATSGVVVTVAQTATTVTVTPAAVTLAEDGARQFSAVGYDQFGDAMASQHAFAWADPSGVGSVDAHGLYTAPAAAGSATITAADGPATGSATVTVAAPAIGAVTGLFADAGVGQVQLTWQRPAGATDGVIIERSTDGLSWAEVGTLDGSTTTFADRAARVATTYQYRAVAFQVVGGNRQESAASNVVTATPERSPAIAPVPPVGVVPPGPMVVVPQPVTVTVPDLPAVPPAGDGPAQGELAEPASGPPAESLVAAAAAAAAAAPDAAGGPDPHPHVAPTPVAPPPPAPKPPESTNRNEGAPAPSSVPPAAGPAAPTARGSAPRSRITVSAAFRSIGHQGGETSAVATEARAARAAEVHRRRVGAVVAAAITAVATGSLLWMVQGGALVATALSALPFWRWVDPLPVLDAWEQDAQRRYDQRRRARRRPTDPSDDEERELGKVID